MCHRRLTTVGYAIGRSRDNIESPGDSSAVMADSWSAASGQKYAEGGPIESMNDNAPIDLRHLAFGPAPFVPLTQP